VFILTLLLTLVFGRVGALRQLETTALDTQLRLRGSNYKEREIVIVTINDDDYKQLFQSKSPLDPVVLKTLLGAIALGKPKVIGVDIDTTAPQFQDFRPESTWPPIVWARAGVYSKVKKKFHLFDVLGGQTPAPLSGATMLKEDDDGALRRYTRNLTTEDGEFPSLPTVLASQFDAARTSRADSKDDLFITYSGFQFQHIYARDILSLAKKPSWPQNDLMKGKIVLLGGSYEASDEHDTPVGWMNGVDVLANATETELQGGGPKPAPRAAIILLQIFDGFLLLLLFQQFRLRKAVVLSLAAVPLFSIIASLLAFRSVAFWAYFAPILIAVLGQQLYERGKDYQKTLITDFSERVGTKPQAKSETQPHQTRESPQSIKSSKQLS
jgi:CHASE2 domain-containing sensor protein